MTTVQIEMMVVVHHPDVVMDTFKQYALSWGFDKRYQPTLEEAVYEIIRSKLELVSCGLEITNNKTTLHRD